MSVALKLLVIIDPTQDRHIALERAISTVKARKEPIKLHLFVGVDAENADLRPSNERIFRDGEWIGGLLAPLDKEGIDYSYELCWSDDWQGAVLSSLQRFDGGHVFMPDYERGGRRLFFSTQQWALLRRAGVPVTIVRPGDTGPRKRMLAAVNIQKEDDARYARLNEKILFNAKDIAEKYGAELFVVNAYPNSMNYPDREMLMKRSGLDTRHVHVEEGDPEDVIASYAKEIEADTVVIGTLSRSGAQALMKGNTSEKVLRKVELDVIAYS